MKKRFAEEQIIQILKEAEVGLPIKELCRKHNISDITFYTWRKQYGGLDVSEAQRRTGKAKLKSCWQSPCWITKSSR